MRYQNERTGTKRQETDMGRLEELEKRLDERLAALDRRLDGRLADLGPTRAADAAAALRPAVEATMARRGGGVVKAARTAGIPLEQAFWEYATPDKAELVQLFEFTRNSSHVRENMLYAQILDATQFEYTPENDKLNASASMVPAGAGEGRRPIVEFLGGAARFGRVAALAVAAMDNGDREAGIRFLALIRQYGLEKIDMPWVVRMVEGAGLAPVVEDEQGNARMDDQALAKAKSASAGMFLGILAHEAGHLALGHLHGRGAAENNDISRNQEREADSFASSIIASSPFGEYILAGTLFWHYALAQLEEGGRATTHPLSKERFANFVRANPDLAAEFGLGEG